MQLHWVVLIHKFSGFLGLKKSEVPVFLAPSVHHLRQTRSDILTILRFVLTIHAKKSGCFCVSGVMGEQGNTGAPCSQHPVTGAAWHSQKTAIHLQKKSITTARPVWGCTCDCAAKVMGGVGSQNSPTFLAGWPQIAWVLYIISSSPKEVVVLHLKLSYIDIHT